MTYVASVGTISWGTYLWQDLVSAFAGELSNFDDKDSVRDLLERAQVALESEEEDDELLEELFEALAERAPPYCYFGATEGDGADFGFWPSMGDIDELPTVEDADAARALGEDAKSVNDHGNVTVYGGDGTVLLEIV